MAFTIRSKFTLGLFFIFLLFFLILNQLVSRNIESGNRRIMTEDLTGLKNNSSAYIRQSFLTHHFANDEVYLGQMAEELAADLTRATSSDAAVYSLKGELLYTAKPALFSGAGDDLQQALQGKTAYTVFHEDGTTAVRFSYPVVIDGQKVGIMRFAKDFSLLYEQSSRIRQTIFFITLAVFAAAFLFSYLLSQHITVPLTRLTKASSEVMNGNLDVSITFRRKDEIGKLAANFTAMIGKLKSQFARIEKDRDRLEELNSSQKRFFDNVTHELKTPLTTIMGYAEIIQVKKTQDPAFFEKGMSHIVDESKRLHGMVLKLLDMSKMSPGRESFTRVEAGQILRDVCDSMTLKARRYQKTIRCGTEAGLFVYGQEDKLRQLFINLIDNAIKYGQAYTEIKADGRLGDGGLVIFTIRNESDTIPPEELGRIFEPFYRADRTAKEESSGLGLAICKEIAEQHLGGIRLASASGRTEATIEIPYSIEEDGERI